jgi:hypothetical protein
MCSPADGRKRVLWQIRTYGTANKYNKLDRVHAIAWQAVSKQSYAEDIAFTSVCFGCVGFNWLQDQPDLLCINSDHQAI